MTVGSVSDVSLVDNDFTANASGAIVSFRAGGGSITGNTFNGTSTTGNLLLSGSGVSVSGNTFDGSSTASSAYQIHDATDSYNISNLLSGNIFDRAVTVLHTAPCCPPFGRTSRGA